MKGETVGKRPEVQNSHKAISMRNRQVKWQSSVEDLGRNNLRPMDFTKSDKFFDKDIQKSMKIPGSVTGLFSIRSAPGTAIKH
jgi:hypothetical protein